VFDWFLPFEFLFEFADSLRDSGHLLVLYQVSLPCYFTCLSYF
jgi:hypothetical protein